MPTSVQAAVRDGIARAVAAVGLLAVAVAHLLDAPGSLTAKPYVGIAFVGLIVSCVAIAGALVAGSARRTWQSAAGLALSTIIAYALTATSLPKLGLASLFVEGSLFALCAAVLVSRRAPQS
jgi:hypothetical protein